MKPEGIKTRKKYDADFKRNAVELVLSGHRSSRSVERDLGRSLRLEICRVKK